MLDGRVDTKMLTPPPAAASAGRGVAAASPRWRSTGWTPLAYPSSAIFAPAVAADAPPDYGTTALPSSSATDNNKCHYFNPHFPLHEDVILAAARELLVLDGSVDGRTLTVTAEDDGTGADDDPDDPPAEKNGAAMSDRQQGKKRKRSVDLSLGEAPVEGKKYLRHLLVSRDATTDDALRAKDAKSDEMERNNALPAAEDVAIAILKRATAVQTGLKDEVHIVAGLVQSIKHMPRDDYRSAVGDRPPRKVSDVDVDSIRATRALPPTGAQSLPPSLTIVASNGYHVPPSNTAHSITTPPSIPDGGALSLSSDILPPLLDMSISVEAYLRKKAYEMTKQMASTFDERPLREFLGYKSSSPKRDRVLHVMSDFLFDVSHAMFAWMQTEREMLLERARAQQQASSKSLLPTSSLWNEELERRVCDALFDRRALKKIGGFDPSSLLPHALSINRVRGRGMSWKGFAVTGVGRKMFRHLREGNAAAAAVVGQKRRGQRPRNRHGLFDGIIEDERGTRSRSSSIASISDGSECQHEKPVFNNMPSHHSDSGGSTSAIASGNTSINIVPDLIPLRLKREKGNSWGVKLAKEGTMCVVYKAPEGNAPIGKGRLGLQRGDLIVSVQNERGESVCSPSSPSLKDAVAIDGRKVTNNSLDWFRDAVNLFKTSNTLHLEVRRVNPVSVIA